MAKHRISIQLLMVVFLCLGAESMAWLILRKKNIDIGFFIAKEQKNITHKNDYKQIGLDEIDPLLGWA